MHLFLRFHYPPVENGNATSYSRPRGLRRNSANKNPYGGKGSLCTCLRDSILPGESGNSTSYTGQGIKTKLCKYESVGGKGSLRSCL